MNAGLVLRESAGKPRPGSGCRRLTTCALRLRAIVVFGTRAVTIQKQRFAVALQKHHGRLAFMSYRQWPRT